MAAIASELPPDANVHVAPDAPPIVAPEADPNRRWSKEGIAALVEDSLPRILEAASTALAVEKKDPRWVEPPDLEDVTVTLDCDDVGQVDVRACVEWGGRSQRPWKDMTGMAIRVVKAGRVVGAFEFLSGANDRGSWRRLRNAASLEKTCVAPDASVETTDTAKITDAMFEQFVRDNPREAARLLHGVRAKRSRSSRVTTIDVRYVEGDPSVEFRAKWCARRDDGGPITGTSDFFTNDDELAKFLMHFIAAREGVVRIVREAHVEFDRLNDAREAERAKTQLVKASAAGDAHTPPGGAPGLTVEQHGALRRMLEARDAGGLEAEALRAALRIVDDNSIPF